MSKKEKHTSQLRDGESAGAEEVESLENAPEEPSGDASAATGEFTQSGKGEKAEPQENHEKGPEEIIAELKEQLSASGDRYLRLMAEFDNFKKRTSREYARMVESANEKLMVEMIDIRETFERAMKHAESCTDYGQLLEGFKLIFTKFDGVLSGNGLSSFAAPGDQFDPQLHDALMKLPNQEIPEDHIAEIYEKGYRLRDRVIKHARVIVSAGTPDADDGEDGEKHEPH